MFIQFAPYTYWKYTSVLALHVLSNWMGRYCDTHFGVYRLREGESAEQGHRGGWAAERSEVCELSDALVLRQGPCAQGWLWRCSQTSTPYKKILWGTKTCISPRRFKNSKNRLYVKEERTQSEVSDERERKRGKGQRFAIVYAECENLSSWVGFPWK